MTKHSRALRALLAAGVVAAAWPIAAFGAITAVGPAQMPATVAKTSAQALLAPAAPARQITLAAPSDDERALLRAKNSASTVTAGKRALKGPLALAFPRAIPNEASDVALADLPWQTLADGRRAAKIEIASPGAAALRVALALPAGAPGVAFRFEGNGLEAPVFGPTSANAVAADTSRFGEAWSPVLEGDVATIEVDVDVGMAIPPLTLSLTRVSHQVVAPAALEKLDAKAVQDIGTSGPCEIDVACVTPRTDALVAATKAVAAIEFMQADGYTYLCSGQLLNDSRSSNTPYFLSANHCLDSALAASTLNTFWFFDAIACGSKAVPAYVQQASGAAMLARSVDWDWSLVRLNAPPPPGATFSAWRAEPVPAFTPITVLHHPQGDFTKWSAGTASGYQLYTDGSSFAQVQYGAGTTEPGSSGAGLMTLNPAGFYEVRGGLWRGAASCQNPGGIDEYSRLDSMLPLTRQYLTPDSPGTPGTAVAVEFYDAALDHYFMTSSAAEINDLDNGVHGGWERTGLTFLTYQVQAPGTNPVCRFYRTPGFGDSHFYSASPSECQAVIADPVKFPGWTFESANVFYVALPDPVTGACASGTQPIWRFFNQKTTNHRYTADHATRDDMRADPATWIPEGYGPDSVIMCAPVGG
jgi:hypothetical protein